MRDILLAGCAALALSGAACDPGMMDPDEEQSDDEVFYDGDEKADGATAPKPAGAKTARGSVWEYDPGPPAGSRWAELFAATPNYRQLGIRVLGGKALTDEKWRWESGPMYYRGRLTPASVKVFIVGQEGAQDESASGRSFTGSTGTKMQNFLRVLGINRSYLFMNTFVYPIHGQYTEMDGTITPQTRWIAQSPDSPIVRHRHGLFNYMLQQNQASLGLVIGVGVAGRDSVVTWVQSLWNARQPGTGATRCATITRCDASIVGPGVRVLGLPHPGAANPRNGGDDALTSLSSQFRRAVNTVGGWAKASPGWLPIDPGLTSRFGAYVYTNYPAPYADFAFGTMDVLGAWGTTSNRRDDGLGIQVYSDDGCYNNAAKDMNGKCLGDPNDPNYKTISLQYKNLPDLTKSIPEMPATDAAWESPRAAAAQFDPGPSDPFARLLTGSAQGLPLPDFAALGVTEHRSLGDTWPYRGRLESAKTLVLADQESHDDMFCSRALCGTGGQRLQTFLKLMNAGTDYAIVRSLPVDTLDLTPAQALAVATDAKVIALLKQVVTLSIQKSATRRILTIGPMAKEQLRLIGAGAVPVSSLASPDDALAHVAGWQDALRTLGASKPTDYTGKLYTTLPRIDLPVHSKWWVGTAGSRADRAYNPTDKRLDPNYYKVGVPDWVGRLPPPALTAEEEALVKLAPPR